MLKTVFKTYKKNLAVKKNFQSLNNIHYMIKPLFIEEKLL